MSFGQGSETVLHILFVAVLCLVNTWANINYKPVSPAGQPTYAAEDTTVVIPSTEGYSEKLVNTVSSILRTATSRIIVVCPENRFLGAQGRWKDSGKDARVELYSTPPTNKRIQMILGIAKVKTPITILCDDDVTWPETLLSWLLAPFESHMMGGAVTCQRLVRAVAPNVDQRCWNAWGAFYLERRNYDCIAGIYMDGGMPCLSGRTVAYRSSILQSEDFLAHFKDERWRGRKMNADDDNCLTRWLVNHGWNMYFQKHEECEVRTTLESSSLYLQQCLRWSRSNWRSNITSMFHDLTPWHRNPWTTWAFFTTTLHQCAFVYDAVLFYLLHHITSEWALRQWTFASLWLWVYASRMTKLWPHFKMYPQDLPFFLLVPFFGWFHSLVIKPYAWLTLNNTSWGNRSADADNDLRLMPTTATNTRAARNSIVHRDEKSRAQEDYFDGA